MPSLAALFTPVSDTPSSYSVIGFVRLYARPSLSTHRASGLAQAGAGPEGQALDDHSNTKFLAQTNGISTEDTEPDLAQCAQAVTAGAPP
jgi:hypothetical protein